MVDNSKSKTNNTTHSNFHNNCSEPANVNYQLIDGYDLQKDKQE